ncbi:uncharacterized protein LOC131323183 isoform X1 [Rhododendron vialii]|uniref:uncharacterized protein LOC131323183 isoform X1 n=1 Tax=Rhododendron vialii TaxID=182163 RepID=UPI00265FC4B8|nr:uncharacterized protein LOC131323183 isoform X1 [Rhododendron vialii]
MYIGASSNADLQFKFTWIDRSVLSIASCVHVNYDLDAALYLKRLSPSLPLSLSLSLSLRLSLCFLLYHGGAGVGVTHRRQKAHNKLFKENFPDNKSLLVMRWLFLESLPLERD